MAIDTQPRDGGREQFFGLLQSGLDLLDQGLTVFDHRLELVAWNRAFFELLDFPPALGRVGTPFAAFMRHNAERGEYGPGAVEDLVRERVQAAQAFESHVTERTRPNGRVIHVRGEPLPGKGFITIYTDVTDQRRYERMLREQNTLLEARVAQAQKMEAVGQLTGGVAHDFNNLLTVVLGNLLALQEQLGAHPAAVEHLPPALDAGRRGVDLVKRLLAFSRRQPTGEGAVDVGAAVAGMRPLLRRSLPENIRLHVELPAASPWAAADPVALESALLNLALNARDAMPEGGELAVTVDVAAPAAAEASTLGLGSGPYVRVAVRDTGIGMDEATAARAFEPFFTTKPFGAGSGLGLAMVYGFVRQSRGAVRIDSRPGAGTTVTLWLPAAPAVPPALPTRADTPQAAAARPLVLLVEDDDAVRAVVRRQVTRLGYPVLEAANAEDALQLIANVAEVGIVLTDVVMTGGLGGRDLVRQARRLRPGLHCVLMTGYERDEGPEDHLPVLAKPLADAALARALEGCAP